LLAESFEAGGDEAEADEAADGKEDDGGGDLDAGIGEDGEEAAAQAGDGIFENGLLRSIDGKLVRKLMGERQR